jgi:hypothetical protein
MAGTNPARTSVPTGTSVENLAWSPRAWTFGDRMSYGIYDTRDDCWLGDDVGPKRFEDFALAKMAAQVWEGQIESDSLGGRFEARELPEQQWGLRDEIEVRRSALDSIRRIEGGSDRKQ